MSAKKAAELNTGYPIFGIKFLDNKTVLAVGGGGEGKNGIPNKITAVKCSLKVADKNRRLQRYREITLPQNEDSPMCVETTRSSGDDGFTHSIFVGCNQSSALIKNMNVNNNLRKYGFTEEEHLKFLDAVQFDHTVLAESIGTYPKLISLSPESEIGAFMTSLDPSDVYIYRPDSLELVAKVRSSSAGEIRDLQVSPHDGGRFLCLVTSSSVEVINNGDGSVVSVSSQKADKKSQKILAKYSLSKVRFFKNDTIVITASLRSGKGSAILRYDITNHKVISEARILKKNAIVVALDISLAQNLVAVAHNDITVTLIRLSDFKILSTIPKLHQFAITSLSFSPSGTKLATGSASQTLNVMPIPPNYAAGTSLMWSLFKFLMFIFVIFAGVILQQGLQAGQLDPYIDMIEQHIGPIDHYVDLTKKHGGNFMIKAQEYGVVAAELSQKYGSEYLDKAQVYGKIGYEVLKEKSAYGIDLIKEKMNKDKPDDQENTKPYFTMSAWEDNPENLVETETATTANIPNNTLNDIVSEVTKAVDHLTNVDGEIDRSSIIEEAVQLDTDVSVKVSAETGTLEDAQESYSTESVGGSEISEIIDTISEGATSVATQTASSVLPDENTDNSSESSASIEDDDNSSLTTEEQNVADSDVSTQSVQEMTSNEEIQTSSDVFVEVEPEMVNENSTSYSSVEPEETTAFEAAANGSVEQPSTEVTQAESTKSEQLSSVESVSIIAELFSETTYEESDISATSLAKEHTSSSTFVEGPSTSSESVPEIVDERWVDDSTPFLENDTSSLIDEKSALTSQEFDLSAEEEASVAEPAAETTDTVDLTETVEVEKSDTKISVTEGSSESQVPSLETLSSATLEASSRASDSPAKSEAKSDSTTSRNSDTSVSPESASSSASSETGSESPATATSSAPSTSSAPTTSSSVVTDSAESSEVTELSSTTSATTSLPSATTAHDEL